MNLGDDLLLVPTKREIDVLASSLHDVTGLSIQMIGLGAVAAAARTASLLSRYQPRRVVLAGIAGTFDQTIAPVGSACRFNHVQCDGIGVGVGEQFISAADLGWSQFEHESKPRVIKDALPLIATFDPKVASAGTLLTVMAASADDADAEWRRQRFPNAVAEDMEGFAVATACSLADVDLQIIRGISNPVGQRDHDSWRVQDALHAAGDLVRQILSHHWIPTIA